MFKKQKELRSEIRDLKETIFKLQEDKLTASREYRSLLGGYNAIKDLPNQEVEIIRYTHKIDKLKSEKDNLSKDLEQARAEIHELNSRLSTIRHGMKELQEKKEEFETQNVILKSANKVLSNHNINIQEVVDAKVALESEVKSLKEVIKLKDGMLEREGKAYNVLKADNNKLLDAIIEFQTKEAQIIQPSLIQPTILSSKTE